VSLGLWWSLLSTACLAAGSLWVTPILVRTLGPGEFGIYSLVIVFASYFGLFDFGLTWAAARYFTDDLACGDNAALLGRFRTLRTFLLGIGGACMLASVFIGPLLMHAVGASADAHTGPALLMGTASFALALQIQLMGALLRAAQLFVAFGRAIALGSALLTLVSYGAVRLGLGLSGLIAVNIAVNLIVLLMCWVHSLPLLGVPKGAPFRLAYLRQMMTFGGWSTLSRVVMIVMLQMDRLAVALVGQTAGLTYYAVPASLASRLNVVGGPAATLFFARASALHAEGNWAELSRQHGQAVRFQLWATVALSVPLIALGPAFLSVWIGPEMALRGGPILIVLAVGYCLNSMTTLHAVTLEAMGHPNWTARNMLCWSAPAIVGVLAGVSRYGCLAIALGVAGWQCGVAVTNLMLCRRLGLGKSTKEWWGVLAAGLCAFFVALPLQARINSVFIGLTAMSIVGVVALAAGWMIVLAAADRFVLLALLRAPMQRLNRFRILAKTA
jgi:O-antigen/teichoic acid export membrane protein